MDDFFLSCRGEEEEKVVEEEVVEEEETDGAKGESLDNNTVIICVYTSVSTEEFCAYYNHINSIVSDAMYRFVNVRMIAWNTGGNYCYIEDLVEPDDDPQPVSFLRILKNVKEKYHLILTTDGKLIDSEINACRKILKNSDILSNILSFEIHFIGNTCGMNLRLSDLFVVKNKWIIINDQEPIEIIDIDVDMLTYDDCVHSNNIIGSVLELVKLKPEMKKELCVHLCHLKTYIPIENTYHYTSLEGYYTRGDIEGCVEFVQKFSPYDKIKFITVLSKLIEICTSEDIDLYSISHLVTAKHHEDIIAEVTVTDDDDDVTNLPEDWEVTIDKDDVLSSNIEFIKRNAPCAEIISLKNNEDKIISDSESKLILRNPWLILSKPEIVSKIVSHVGNCTYDLITKNQMDEACSHYYSGFLRQEIYGVYIFHDKHSAYNLILKNNYCALSFMFNNNYILPGNKPMIIVLFLYILGTYHPYWKQHSKMIQEELIAILPLLVSFVTLNPFLNPLIIDKLEICLWYVVNVSHCAFPDSAKNILRFMEGTEKFIELYEYLFPDRDVHDVKFKIKVWSAWKYLIRNRTSKNLRLEVISQYQNHEIIDGNYILLSGESRKQSIGLNPLHTKNLYNYMLSKSRPVLFETIPFDKLDEGEVIPRDGIDDSVEQVDHIKICLTTCRPLYSCPVSKTVWKDCVNKYDAKKKSFFKAFVRFCDKFKKYPETVEEFLIYHSNQYNFVNKGDDCIIYGKDIKKCLQAVLKCYSRVMKLYSPKDFVKTYNKNCDIDCRLKNEKDCRCNVH